MTSNSITYSFSDFNHEFEKHCTIAVDAGNAQITYKHWLDINPDYLDDDDEEEEEPYTKYVYDSSLCFATVAELQEFFRTTVAALKNACFVNYVDGRENLDFDPETTTFSEADSAQVDMHANVISAAQIEAAYGCSLPLEVKSLIDGDDKSLHCGTIAQELPEASQHSGDAPAAWLRVAESTLLQNVELFSMEDMCPFAEFYGMPNKVMYFGVVHAHNDGRIFVQEDQTTAHLLAPNLKSFLELLTR